jgi:hypothetical protein
MGDITGANAQIFIMFPVIIPVPVQLQGFAMDDVFDTNEVNSVETFMGVDGILSAGMIFEKTELTITFQADSDSIPLLEGLDQAQQAGTAAYPGVMNVTLTSVGRSYQATPIYLVRLHRIPGVKKTIQPRKFMFHLGNIIPIPVGLAG